MKRIIKNASYGTDVGSSDRLPFTNEKGEAVLAPKRWTKSWVQALSHKDFWAVYHAQKDSIMNCKNEECQMELCEFADDDEFYEVRADGKPRYSGYCADCYDDLRSGDLENQLERMFANA